MIICWEIKQECDLKALLTTDSVNFSKSRNTLIM